MLVALGSAGESALAASVVCSAASSPVVSSSAASLPTVSSVAGASAACSSAAFLAAGFFALEFLLDALRVEDDRDPALAEDFEVDRFGGLCFVATGVRVPDVAPSPLAVYEDTQTIGHRRG